MYDIHTRAYVLEYLFNVDGLSAAAVEQLIADYTKELGANADYFFQRYPLAHESLCFRYDTVVVDGNSLHEFTFVADMRSAEAGVVELVHVEHQLLGTRTPPP